MSGAGIKIGLGVAGGFSFDPSAKCSAGEPDVNLYAEAGFTVAGYGNGVSYANQTVDIFNLGNWRQADPTYGTLNSDFSLGISTGVGIEMNVGSP